MDGVGLGTGRGGVELRWGGAACVVLLGRAGAGHARARKGRARQGWWGILCCSVSVVPYFAPREILWLLLTSLNLPRTLMVVHCDSA